MGSRPYRDRQLGIPYVIQLHVQRGRGDEHAKYDEQRLHDRLFIIPASVQRVQRAMIASRNMPAMTANVQPTR